MNMVYVDSLHFGFVCTLHYVCSSWEAFLKSKGRAGLQPYSAQFGSIGDRLDLFKFERGV